MKHENRIRALEAAQRSHDDQGDGLLSSRSGVEAQSTTINTNNSSNTVSTTTKGAKDIINNTVNVDSTRTGNGEGSYISSTQSTTQDNA